jgi:hypothetical protein
MTQSAVRGALLANEVGTGKTMVFLMERKFAIDRRVSLLRDAGLDESDDATAAGLPMVMPTVIFAPASVIEQHFDEINNYFPVGTYHIRVYHGSKNNTSHNPPLQKAVMSNEALTAEMELAVADRRTSKVSGQMRLLAAGPYIGPS